MSTGSKEFLSVDQIRERIRGRVRQTTDSPASRRHETPLPIKKESLALALHRFSKLRLKLQDATYALNNVGALNPRPEGWRNDILQFVKKCVRRSLAWLLRPIQQFDSAVMETLEETHQILADFQTEMRSIVARVEDLEDLLNASYSAPIHENGESANGKSTNGKGTHGGTANGRSEHMDVDEQIRLLQRQMETIADDIRNLARDRAGKR